MERLGFTDNQVSQFGELAQEHGTPLFIYDSEKLAERAEGLLNLNAPFGHIVRYAVKANPHSEIVETFDELGLHFDASSAYEAEELIESGVDPVKISLSAQTLEGPIEKVISEGVLPVATSFHQMERIKDLGLEEFAVRINPGLGSGHSNRTNVGGPASSFGIWHEYLPRLMQYADANGIKINRLHTHIGSGADPGIWRRVIDLSLQIADQMPDVETLDVGGGYKVARMSDEAPTDMNEVFKEFSAAIGQYAEKSDRHLRLEIEPGTHLVANAGTLLARVEDIVDTGSSGYEFLRLNTGMNDILRPSLYGAQHPIEVLNDGEESAEYVVVGHNCESGDIFTPAPGDSEAILPRQMKKAAIGDLVAIGSVGAYCASMRATGYNSFPSAKEIVV